VYPENFLDPPEPVEIHPRPARTRIFLFTAIPAPAARQLNVPRPPRVIKKKCYPPARRHVAPRAPRVETRDPHVSGRNCLLSLPFVFSSSTFRNM
jgi:hypothetical protein